MTLIIVGLKKVTRPNEVILPLLFLPVFGYLTASFSKIKKRIKIPLLAYNLFFSIILLVAEAINIRKINEVAILLAVTPLPIFFILESRKGLMGIAGSIKNHFKPKTNDEVQNEKLETKEVIDETRRKFLKVAAGTSLATAIMYFMNRQKAGAAFFGSVPGPGTIAIKDSSGNKVNPSIQQPLDGYNISDMDTSGATQYFGFLNKDNAWYILKIGEDNSIRYARGATNYSTLVTGAWVTRSGQSYGAFGDVF